MSEFGSEDSSKSPKNGKDATDLSNADQFGGNGEYAETSRLSFQDLLKFHNKQTVWGFQFGKEVRESTLKIMQGKQGVDNVSGECTETTSNTDKAGSSKSMTEKDHKTPHSRKRIEASRTSKRKNSTKHNDFVSPQKTRRAPLPLMDWADSKEVCFFITFWIFKKYRTPLIDEICTYEQYGLKWKSYER